ncbi:MAG TPA: adenine phosphoribosyltransferase [Cytophagales bacterium]|nr:adenine phosphoribosyltransferase [Cytophagales bacterium]
MTSLDSRIKNTIRDVKDYPKPGIIFKDLTPILKDTQLCKDIIGEFVSQLSHMKPDALCCLDARGFWFGLSISLELGIPMVPVRKKGKLPYETICQQYELEYGTSEIEIHTDAFEKGMRVVIHDDLLATGGTASAAAELVRKSGAEVVGYAFMVELCFLMGAERVKHHSDRVLSLCRY